MTLKTFVYTFALLLVSSFLPLQAQVKQKATPTDTLRTLSNQPVKKPNAFKEFSMHRPKKQQRHWQHRMTFRCLPE